MIDYNEIPSKRRENFEYLLHHAPITSEMKQRMSAVESMLLDLKFCIDGGYWPLSLIVSKLGKGDPDRQAAKKVLEEMIIGAEKMVEEQKRKRESAYGLSLTEVTPKEGAISMAEEGHGLSVVDEGNNKRK